MQKTLLHVLPSLALVSACTAGVGPIGVGAIGDREDPAGGSAGATGSPEEQSSGPSSGGTSAGGALSCTGTYACATSGGSVFSAQLSAKSGGCEANIDGDDYLLSSDGKVTTGGNPYGTWRTSGTAVIVCESQSACVTCVPGSGGSGVTDSGSGG